MIVNDAVQVQMRINCWSKPCESFPDKKDGLVIALHATRIFNS